MTAPMAIIRLAREEDAAAMLAIYAPYVRHTAISFETEPPCEEEVRQRVRATLEVGLWLLCEAGRAGRARPVSGAAAAAGGVAGTSGVAPCPRDRCRPRACLGSGRQPVAGPARKAD